MFKDEVCSKGGIANGATQQLKVTVKPFKILWEVVRRVRELHQLILLQVQIHTKFRTHILDDRQSSGHFLGCASDNTVIQVPLVQLEVWTLLLNGIYDLLDNQTEQSRTQRIPLLDSFSDLERRV